MPDADFSREPHTTTFVSIDKLDVMIAFAKQWMEEFQACKAIAEKLGFEGLAMHGTKSWPIAVDKMRTVISGCQESRNRAVDGNPMEVGERKPRSRDKADANLDAQRSRHYAIVAEKKAELPKKAPTKKKGT